MYCYYNQDYFWIYSYIGGHDIGVKPSIEELNDDSQAIAIVESLFSSWGCSSYGANQLRNCKAYMVQEKRCKNKAHMVLYVASALELSLLRFQLRKV